MQHFISDSAVNPVNLSYLLVSSRLQALNSLIDTETMNLEAIFWKAIYNTQMGSINLW